MNALDLVKTIKTLIELDVANDDSLALNPGASLMTRLKMIEAAISVALEQAEADFGKAWRWEGLPGQPAQVSLDSANAVIAFLQDARGSWTLSESLKAAV